MSASTLLSLYVLLEIASSSIKCSSGQQGWAVIVIAPVIVAALGNGNDAVGVIDAVKNGAIGG